MAIFINNYDRNAEQLALLAEYEAQKMRLEAVREVDVLTGDEMQEAEEDYQEYLLDVEWMRGGC